MATPESNRAAAELAEALASGLEGEVGSECAADLRSSARELRALADRVERQQLELVVEQTLELEGRVDSDLDHLLDLEQLEQLELELRSSAIVAGRSSDAETARELRARADQVARAIESRRAGK
jgi:hypothetical protein